MTMMAVSAFTVCVLGVLAAGTWYFTSTVASFLENRNHAKKMGIPVLYSPFSHFNSFWMIFGPVLRPLLQKLPYGLGSWTHYARHNWIWEDHAEMQRKYGSMFAVVSPREITMYCADLDVIREIYARKKAFEKDQEDHMMPPLLTPSVTTVTGSEWQRQRRITAPPFNESNMSIVWHDSLRQTRDVAQWWSSAGEKGFKSSCRDTMTLALNVLAAAGLGLTWPFTPEGRKIEGEDEFAAKYRDNLTPLITDIVLLSLTPSWLYKYGPRFAKFLPRVVGDHVAMAETFRGLMRQLVDERRAQIKAGEATQNIFLNAIISKSPETSEKSINKEEEGSSRGLSEAEVFGNMVDYNIAGHETTAHTLNYCLHILSVEPQVQEWLHEELDYVFGDSKIDPDTLDYAETFPKLKRCLAMMFEMLRVYPPVVMHSKQCLAPKGRGQELHINGRAVYIPARTILALPTYAVQIMPEYWGPDSREWKPKRWLKSKANDAGSLAEILESEEILPPPIAKETFLPWSSGARDCPGKKFAQVEFVAVMAYILRHYKVEAVPLEGETYQDTRKRIWDYTKDSVSQITINFREPDKYALRLVSRGKL